jgi:type VI protein secretion system component VasK
MMIPLGFTAGMPYVFILVWAMAMRGSRLTARHVVTLAMAATVLSLTKWIEHTFHIAPIHNWMELDYRIEPLAYTTNRLLAIAVFWCVAWHGLTIVKVRRKEEKQEQDDFERRYTTLKKLEELTESRALDEMFNGPSGQPKS